MTTPLRACRLISDDQVPTDFAVARHSASNTPKSSLARGANSPPSATISFSASLSPNSALRAAPRAPPSPPREVHPQPSRGRRRAPHRVTKRPRRQSTESKRRVRVRDVRRAEQRRREWNQHRGEFERERVSARVGRRSRFQRGSTPSTTGRPRASQRRGGAANVAGDPSIARARGAWRVARRKRPPPPRGRGRSDARETSDSSARGRGDAGGADRAPGRNEAKSKPVAPLDGVAGVRGGGGGVVPERCRGGVV